MIAAPAWTLIVLLTGSDRPLFMVDGFTTRGECVKAGQGLRDVFQPVEEQRVTFACLERR